MRCRAIRFLLPLHVGGDLSEFLDRWVTRHVDGCEACAADLEQLHQTRERVRVLAKQHTPTVPIDFAAQIRSDAVDDKSREMAFGRRYKWAIAAAAVVVFTGWGLFQEWQQGNVSEVTIIVDSNVVPEEAAVVAEKLFTKGDLEAMMSRLNPDRTLTDDELDAKYPVVENVKIPNGTQVVYHTDDPNTKIVWVIAQEGAQVQ